MAETGQDARSGDIRAKLQEYANRDDDSEHSLFPRTLLALLDSVDSLADAVQRSDKKQNAQAEKMAKELKTALSDNAQQILEAIKQAECAAVDRHKEAKKERTETREFLGAVLAVTIAAAAIVAIIMMIGFSRVG